MNGAAASVYPLGAAIVLALLQGITEFLPVSSSGHLAAAQLLWPTLAYPGVTLELALHLGTTLAVLLYYRDLVTALVKPSVTPTKDLMGLSRGRWWFLLFCGSIPTVLIGLLGQDIFRDAFERLSLIATSLAITGVVLMSTRLPHPEVQSVNVWRALVIGTAQGFALLPGLSRSGMTISSALLLGVPKRQAVTFSLLLSVPAVLGATLLDAIRLSNNSFPARLLFENLLFATLAAVVVGYLCIGLLHRATRHDWWHRFAWYCWLLAAMLAWAAR